MLRRDRLEAQQGRANRREGFQGAEFLALTGKIITDGVGLGLFLLRLTQGLFEFARRGGPLVIGRHRIMLCAESSHGRLAQMDLLLERLTLLRAGRQLAFQLAFQFSDGLAGGALALMGGHRDLGVMAGIGQFLQQLRAFIVFGAQEGAELALRQQHGAGELREIQPQPVDDQRLGVIVGGVEGLSRLGVIAGGQQLEMLPGILQAAAGLAACAADRPAGAIAQPIAADEIHLGLAFAAATPEQAARVLERQLMLSDVGQFTVARSLI